MTKVTNVSQEKYSESLKMVKRIRKKNVGYNLTPLAIEMLKVLADYHGQSLSAELDRIIRDSYRHHKNAIEQENKSK